MQKAGLLKSLKSPLIEARMEVDGLLHLLNPLRAIGVPWMSKLGFNMVQVVLSFWDLTLEGYMRSCVVDGQGLPLSLSQRPAMWTSDVELNDMGSGRQSVGGSVGDQRCGRRLTSNAGSGSLQFGIRACSMAPRRRPREGVAEQATRQEVGDAPPPQQTQPLPQDEHSGIVPPPPPPAQVAQGLDMTRFLEGMAQFVAQHRDAPVPQGGTGRVLRKFLQFQPPQFLGQPNPDIARAWLDAVERTFRSMECVPEERVLQIPWQEFVVSFERAFCPTYVRTERLYQFLDLQQRDSTVVQYRARFVELGRYAPQIMGDEGLRTQQFVRGLRPELRQALIVARVTDLDAAYQTAAALEADTLRTRARSAEVQTQVVPSQPRQQQGSVQTTPRTATSYASTSTGTTAKSGSRRKFRRDRRQAE
ncbi:hypothetical protein Taro_020756 [Colocasia esculenta]|uniref:Retrotransposon gag domain-containing protein n=1 Tax=Colocasia esculenta TaxID=4460 RepID=A0A843V3A7_COLES|nr:hypothetical protein [Colocasia esculenta]